jgi:hypothetical protein
MRIVDLRQVPKRIQQEIAAFVQDNPRRYDGMSWDVSYTWGLKDAIDAWLHWHGVSGMTEDLCTFIRYSRDEATDACLEEALAELEGMVDIQDSEHGPRPNTAMRASMLIEQALGRRPIV